MTKESLDKTISVRLNETILEALANRALVENKDRAELIRDAITNYLGLPKDSIEEQMDLLHRRALITEQRLTGIELVIQDLKDFLEAELSK